MATGYRLLRAVQSGDLKSVKHLIGSFGLYYSPLWLEGYALLIDALKNKHTDIARVLLAHGCKVNIKYNKPEDTPLHLAVKNGDLEILKLLLERGADVLAEDNEFMTTLHLAALRKEDEFSTEIIKLLLKVQNDVDATSVDEKTSLHIAVEAHNFKIAEFLLNHGASVHLKCNSTSFKGGTVLHLLIEKGDQNSEDIGNIILSKGAKINAQTDNGATPLHIAASRGCKQSTEFLLKNNALIDCCSIDDMTPMQVAVSEEHEEVLELLLRYGAEINFKGGRGKTLLHFAVDKEIPSIVKLILKYHPDVQNENNRLALYHAIVSTTKIKGEIIVKDLLEYGYTLTNEEMSKYDLLHGAVQKGCYEIVENILRQGIQDINTLHNVYGTPLHTAAANSQEKIAKMLIAHGADVNIKDYNRKTPLFYSIQSENIDLFEILLKEGANVEDHELLFIAILTGKEDIVRTLLGRNINVNTPGANGDFPLHVAVTGFQHLTKILLDHGAKPNVISISGTTPLHVAVEREYIEAVVELLEYGADPNIQDNLGNTPLHIAIESGDNEIVVELLHNDADTNVKNEKGDTSMHLAVKSQCEFIMMNVLDYDGDINIVDRSGCTSLDYVESREIFIEQDDDESIEGYESESFIREMYEALNKYIIMLKTAKLPVTEHNLNISSSYKDKDGMTEECSKEINIMKAEKICNNITFYDILTKNVDQLAIYTRNDQIVKLTTEDYSTKFPIYASLIENAFLRGFQRNYLMKKHNQFFSSVFPNLPLICIEEILSYLTNKELEKFIIILNFTSIESKCSISSKIQTSVAVNPRRLLRKKHWLDEILL